MPQRTIIIGAFVTLLAFGCGKSVAEQEEEMILGSAHRYTPDRRKIKEIQLLLMYKGFVPGDVDGTMGPGTRDAIRNFQQSLNLPTSGYLGKKTWSAIMKIRGEGAPSVVTDIQFALRKAGFDPGVIDGTLGEKFREQIAKFQTEKGLDVTRSINPETWSKLREYLKNGR